MNEDYVAVQYDVSRRPITGYPLKLAKKIVDKHKLPPLAKLLEVGAGRPDVLIGFKDVGLQVFACDISPVSKTACESAKIPFEFVDLENGKLPYGDNEFDVVYSKSVIEHMLDPLNFVSESFRVLKPGTLIVLTPDWEANFKTFFDDFTHVRPMTRRSMNLLLSMLDPRTLEVYRFRQLPITWKFPIVNAFCAVISPFIPVKTRNPFFRWSRELMLIGVAVKK